MEHDRIMRCRSSAHTERGKQPLVILELDSGLHIRHVASKLFKHSHHPHQSKLISHPPPRRFAPDSRVRAKWRCGHTERRSRVFCQTFDMLGSLWQKHCDGLWLTVAAAATAAATSAEVRVQLQERATQS